MEGSGLPYCGYFPNNHNKASLTPVSLPKASLTLVGAGAFDDDIDEGFIEIDTLGSEGMF